MGEMAIEPAHGIRNPLPIVPAPTRMSVYRLLEGIRAFPQPVAQQKDIQIVTDCDPDCFAAADFELLHRMLLNLVLNALREIPTDGTVSLKGQVAGRDVLIEVEDTGPGIQEERMARIFDPMFSTSREGCGLGLFDRQQAWLCVRRPPIKSCKIRLTLKQ
jgi:signal transduction histidine kinase